MLPSTQVYEIDFKDIINNAVNREYWEKVWTLFIYDDFTLTMRLDTISIDTRKVMFYIRLENKDYYEYNYLSLPMDQYNETVFRRTLKARVMSTVYEMEYNYIRESSGYKEEREQEIQRRNNLITEAVKKLDREKVTDKGIREAYIKNVNESMTSNLFNYIDKCKGKYLPNLIRMTDSLIKFKGDE